MTPVFKSRRDAGEQLCTLVDELKELPPESILVLGLARGGAAVAAPIAECLHAQLDLAIVRKLGVPWQPEVGIGALAGEDLVLVNEEHVRHLGITPTQMRDLIARELREWKRRSRVYRGDLPAPVIKDRTVILVDDGIATGSSMIVAIRWVYAHEPKRVIVLVPVAPQTAAEMFKDQGAVDFRCLLLADDFQAVGEWYDDFAQVTDSEVQAIVREAHKKIGAE